MKSFKLLTNLLWLVLVWHFITLAHADPIDCGLEDCLGGIEYGKAGFLLAAPDRGYAGNQKVRKAFSDFTKKHNAALVFVTDKRMQPYLQKALNKLDENNAETIVVLPLFYSMSHPRLNLLRSMLELIIDNNKETIYARSFGNTYLAVEMLIERLKVSQFNEQNPLLLLGHGASSQKSLTLMERDLRRIADLALQDFENKKLEVVVLPGDRANKNYREQNKTAWSRINDLGAKHGVEKLLPFHLGPELDGMMAVNEWAKDRMPKFMQMVEFEDNEVEFYSLWMQREANRYLSAKEAPLGIVINAHGSDFHWNQGMREAVEELTNKYPVEFAFSMADPQDLRAAVKRLEQRGVGVIVVVRVFGMRASFRHSIERLIGLDVDAPELCKTEQEDDRHKGEPPMRLRTSALVVTEGGLGDNALFAEAMLDRANQLAVDRADDTVIIVAHGKGTDSANEQWLKVLASLVEKMKAMGGDEFRDIKFQTWQEDWHDKRGERINAVKSMVEEAAENNGHAIVIPARTTGKGRSRQFLKSSEFIAGEGFAPHPLFQKWVEQQLQRGVETVKQTRHVWYPMLPIVSSDK